jgi:hypothetical protein
MLSGAQLRTHCAWPAPLSQKYQAMLVDRVDIPEFPAQEVKKSDLKTTERIDNFFGLRRVPIRHIAMLAIRYCGVTICLQERTLQLDAV